MARWTSWTTRATGSTIRAGTVMVGSRRPVTTNLYNRVQPLLRLEVTDLVTLDPDPCRCGRTLVRGSAIHGRSDDILFLPAHDGGRVAVHPLHFALLTRDPQVRVVQVVQDGPMLRVLVVPSHAAAAGNNELESRLDQAVTQQLLKLGVHDPQVTVERRPKLPRAAGGKLKLVIAAPPPSRSTPTPANRPHLAQATAHLLETSPSRRQTAR